MSSRLPLVLFCLFALGCSTGSTVTAPNAEPSALVQADADSTPQPPRADQVVEIIAPLNAVCYRMADGRVHCSGNNRETQIAQAEEGRYVADNRDVPALSDRIHADDLDFHIGNSFGCALDPDGRVRCWGAYLQGVRGDGCDMPGGQQVCDGEEVEGSSWDYKKSVNTVSDVPPAVELAGGWDSTCLRTQAGEVWCWGWNTDGTIGDGTWDAALRPHRVELPAATELHAGAHHYCTVDPERTIWCWGTHLIDDQPNLTERSLRTPKKITRVERLPDGARLRLTEWGACVIRRDGVTSCWGSLELEQGGPVISERPIELEGVHDIEAGNAYTCVITTRRDVTCNTPEATMAGIGALDEEPFERQWRTVELPFDGQPAQLAGSATWVCVLSDLGEVACWGEYADAYGAGDRVPEDGEYVFAAPQKIAFPKQ